MPLYSLFCPVFAPLLQNTVLEQNGWNHACIAISAKEDMAPFSYRPVTAPPGGYNNLPDLVKTCAPRSSFRTSNILSCLSYEWILCVLFKSLWNVQIRIPCLLMNVSTLHFWIVISSCLSFALFGCYPLQMQDVDPGTLVLNAGIHRITG